MDDDDDDEYHQGTHIILHVVLLYLYVFRSKVIFFRETSYEFQVSLPGLTQYIQFNFCKDILYVRVYPYCK
jgi:hypothetical protein